MGEVENGVFFLWFFVMILVVLGYIVFLMSSRDGHGLM